MNAREALGLFLVTNLSALALPTEEFAAILSFAFFCSLMPVVAITAASKKAEVL